MSSFLNYVAKRILWAIPVLLGVSFIAFFIMHLAPGDPARFMLGQRATPEDVEALRQELGLNRPLYVQYYEFLTRAVQGDLGQSVSTRQPVSTMIVERLPYTIQLATASMIISILIAFPAGILGAIHANTRIDNFGRIGALLGISVPNFWLGLLLIMYLAVTFDPFPISGMTLVTVDPIEGIFTTILPAIALGTALAALLMRLLRGGMLDEIRSGYVTTARSYGIANSEVMYVYVLKNAVLPTLTVIGLQLGALIGGSVIIETVFGIPGIGRLAVDSIFRQDFPVIQGIILLVAVVFVAANLIVDLLYGFLDPRISYGGGEA